MNELFLAHYCLFRILRLVRRTKAKSEAGTCKTRISPKNIVSDVFAFRG